MDLQPGQTSSAPAKPSPETEDAVERLIAAGKCKKAVELAKDLHKKFNTPESEHRLVDAYLGRIDEFRRKNMAEDARTLLALVREKFPRQAHRLAAAELGTAAALGDINRLVAPLTRPDLTPEMQSAIEAGIRQHVTDLPTLAACTALPADHPLRVAAGAIWKAFQAATAGPVTEEQIALPEVSRRSPLAGWKLLVRAIAAFYRRDDASCRRALEGIPSDAAAHRLAPVVLAMLEGSAPPPGASVALHAAVKGDDRALRDALDGIEQALRRVNLPRLQRSIAAAIRACTASHPELLDGLRQHISVACVMVGAPTREVVAVMGPSKKNAYFWRLFARASEQIGETVPAAFYWERFARHALAEGWMAPGSLEEAAVFVRAANDVASVPLDLLDQNRSYAASKHVLVDAYKDQPPEIAALRPRSDKEVADQVMDSGGMYRHAATIDPDPETFKQWWAWAQRVKLPDRSMEDVAKFWHEKRPKDARPLLLLSALAEQRKALKLALTHLSEAEAIDPLDPSVRQARVRLTLATTWRHFKDKKPHLVEKDLAELSALPGMNEGDRGHFLSAVRAALHALRGEMDATRAELKALADRMGNLPAEAIWYSVAHLARVRSFDLPLVPIIKNPDPVEVARAEARAVRLGRELDFNLYRPSVWDSFITAALRQRPCPLSAADLLSIGQSSGDDSYGEQKYLASAAGLADSTGLTAARFLLLRARSLGGRWWANARASQCLRTALELARQSHEPDLVGEILTEIDYNPVARQAMADRRPALGEELINEVLRAEREAERFPKDREEANKHLVLIEEEEDDVAGPFDSLPENSGYPRQQEYEDEDFADEADDAVPPISPTRLTELLESLPPHLLMRLQKMIKKGQLPSPADLSQSDPELAMLLVALLGGLDPGADLDDVFGEEQSGPQAGPFDFLDPRRGKNKKRRK